MQVESIAECSLGVFCDTFDVREAIIGLENQSLLLFWRALVYVICMYMHFKKNDAAKEVIVFQVRQPWSGIRCKYRPLFILRVHTWKVL